MTQHAMMHVSPFATGEGSQRVDCTHPNGAQCGYDLGAMGFFRCVYEWVNDGNNVKSCAATTEHLVKP